jgi:CxxC-x17-CxxC domain-containing protein
MGNFNDRGGRGGDRRGGGGFNRGGNRGGGGFSRDRGDRPTMHKAVCDACKSNCEVPFKPTGNKPIFCSDCFSKQGGGNDRPNKFGGGDRDRKPRFESGGSDNSKEILKGIKTLNYKLDELVKILGSNTPVEKTEKVKAAPKKKATKKIGKKKDATPKKVVKRKTPKKKPVVKKPVKKKKK